MWVGLLCVEPFSILPLPSFLVKLCQNLGVQPVNTCIYLVKLVGIHSNHIEQIKHVYRMVLHPCGLASSVWNHYQCYHYHHYLHFLVQMCYTIHWHTTSKFMYLPSRIGGKYIQITYSRVNKTCIKDGISSMWVGLLCVVQLSILPVTWVRLRYVQATGNNLQGGTSENATNNG